MDRVALTAEYLDRVTRRGIKGGELTGALPRSRLLESQYMGRYLSRPVFLGHAERDRLHADVENLRAALTSLPGRLFGGDLAAFARAAGAGEAQLPAVLRSRSSPATGQARADLYLDHDGFRLLEINMGSPAAGIDNADICRGLLEHPVLAGFAADHDLVYADTMREQVSTIFAETGFAPGSFPVIAMAAEPGDYQRLSPYLHRLAPRWRELGLDARPCSLADLACRDGRVWLAGGPVDIVFRLFLIEHLPGPGGGALAGPLLAAAGRGEVTMFTAMDGDLFSSKAALAMLSDHGNQHLFSLAERASIDRILPWTRMVRPGPVTLEYGRTVELMDYAVEHRHDLVLKPAMLHGGAGVVLGGQHGTSRARWRERLAVASGGPYVLQRRIRPVPELLPGEDGELVPWIITWGVFTMRGGHGGIYTRGAPARSRPGVVNFAAGAAVGCGLSTRPPSPRPASGQGVPARRAGGGPVAAPAGDRRQRDQQSHGENDRAGQEGAVGSDGQRVPDDRAGRARVGEAPARVRPGDRGGNG
jgi:hypothetical protein